MPLPQHIQYQKGGTIHIDLDVLPTAATVRIIDGHDTEQLAHTSATISTVNTTLAAAGNVGNAEINVTLNTGLSAGTVAWIGDDPEEVLVKSVHGSIAHLRRPLVHDHISGATLTGSRLSYSVNSAIANTLWFDGRAEWNVTWSNGTSVYEFSSVECGRYPNKRMATIQDLYDCEPLFRPSREVDVERLLDTAHEMVLAEIAKHAPDQRARTFTGSMEFRRATAAAAMYLYYLPRGGESKDAWYQEFERRLASAVTTTPRDADQDGTIEADERFSMRTVPIRR